MVPSSTRRVVVVGGGIFGTSSALHLARLGCDVMLVTESMMASGASGRSLAWLNSSRHRSMAYHNLRMAGIERYRTLAYRHPETSTWLRFDGGLTWDVDGPENGIEAVFAYETDIGYDAVLLSPTEVKDVTLGVDAFAITRQGAIFNPAEGWVDLPSLIRLLLAEYKVRGGKLIENVGKVRTIVEQGWASAVVLADGRRLDADAVLLAIGSQLPAALAEQGIHLPDQTPIALLLKTKPANHPLRAVLNTPRVAIRPTPDGAFVLDSAWSEEEVLSQDDIYEVRPTTLEGLLREASRVLDGNPQLDLESFGVGPKPIPADGDPVFGELAEIANLFVAFSHSGATLGLIAGEMLAREIATGKTHPMLAPFRPSRFDAAKKIAAE